MKKYSILALLVMLLFSGCAKEEKNVCKLVRNKDFKQEFSLNNSYDWNCMVEDYTEVVGEERVPNYGVKLFERDSEINYLRLYYQYGEPQIFYKPVEAEITEFDTANGYAVKMYVWNYDVTYLLVLFQDEKLTNYAVSGKFELDYYVENKDALVKLIDSVKIK